MLRQSVRAWLEELEIVEPDIAAIVAACSEAAANAVEDASSQDGDAIEITAAMVGGDVVVRCTASAAWKIEAHPSRYVAALLVDDVSIDRAGGTTAVVLRKASSRGLHNLESLQLAGRAGAVRELDEEGGEPRGPEGVQAGFPLCETRRCHPASGLLLQGARPGAGRQAIWRSLNGR